MTGLLLGLALGVPVGLLFAAWAVAASWCLDRIAGALKERLVRRLARRTGRTVEEERRALRDLGADV